MSVSMSGSVITFSDSSTLYTNPVPSGSAMLFQQTSAPTGWTKVTTYNDYAVRIVNGTASSGGSSGFSTCFTNQTPTINVSGLSAGATTLSTGQMPSHSHSWTALTPGCSQTTGLEQGIANYGGTTQIGTNSVGGGGSHNHSISGSASSSAITLAVQYVDHIIATKN